MTQERNVHKRRKGGRGGGRGQGVVLWCQPIVSCTSNHPAGDSSEEARPGGERGKESRSLAARESHQTHKTMM